MRIYITSKGDEVLLDDEDYKKLILIGNYCYYAGRYKKGNII